MMYRTEKVAELLGVNRVTIFRWIKQGKIKTVRIGEEYRIPEDEVKSYLRVRFLTQHSFTLV